MKALGSVLLLVVASPAVAQLTPHPTADYVSAADNASHKYKACLTEHAKPLAAKNKNVSPDVIIKAAKTKCQAEGAILSLYRSDAVVKLVDDKVLADLLAGH